MQHLKLQERDPVCRDLDQVLPFPRLLDFMVPPGEDYTAEVMTQLKVILLGLHHPDLTNYLDGRPH